MLWLIGKVVVVVIAVPSAWWYYSVRKTRAKFRNKNNGKLINGSDNFPFFDYIFHGFMGRNTKAPYGDFELSFFLGFPVIMVSEPRIIKELMKGIAVKDFDKGDLTLAGVEPLAGRQNLFSSDGYLWQHQRSIINPAFRPMYVQMLTKNVVWTIESTLKEWSIQKSPPDDIVSAISNLTLSTICRAAFGIAEAGNHERLFELYTTLMNSLMMKMLGMGYFVDGKLNKASIEIDSIATEGIVHLS